MRLTSAPARRVVWEDGMHLTPQHFQAQSRYQEDPARHTVGLLFPFAYGLPAIALDVDAMHNGRCALAHARGVLADGTMFHMPDADPAPTAVPLVERFSPTRDSHMVHLALPRWRGQRDRPGCRRQRLDCPLAVASRKHALRPSRRCCPTNQPAPIRSGALRRAQPALPAGRRSDRPGGVDAIARVRRDGRGQFQLDRLHPAHAAGGASERLIELLQRTVGLLEAKGAALGNGAAGAVERQWAEPRRTSATKWQRDGCCTPCARPTRRCVTCCSRARASGAAVSRAGATRRRAVPSP